MRLFDLLDIHTKDRQKLHQLAPVNIGLDQDLIKLEPVKLPGERLHGRRFLADGSLLDKQAVPGDAKGHEAVGFYETRQDRPKFVDSLLAGDVVGRVELETL